MRIKLAKTAGFCMGVRRAMDIVLDKINGKENIYTYGPLVHNPQAIEMLESRGVKVLHELDEEISGTVIIRAHGVPPQELAMIQGTGLKILDATCPRVMKVQAIIKMQVKEGFNIIIVGDREHPEVVGLLGFCQGRGMVVSSIEDVNHLPEEMKKVSVVAQTTQDTSEFERIAKKIQEKFSEVKIFNTICNSTAKRQNEVLQLTKNVDGIVVIGGRDSGNTQRLVKISESTGTRTFHVETEEDLDLKKLAGLSSIGITAGASTPSWMINRVVEKIENFQREQRPLLLRLWSNFLEFLINGNLYVAFGAGCLTYVSCLLQGIDPKLSYLLIAGSYVFAMHVLYYFTDRDAAKFNDPGRAEFYKRHREIFITLVILSALVSLFLSFQIGLETFLFFSIIFLFGLMYGVTIIPKGLRKILKYKTLKDIPGSKTLFVALAWGAVISVPPALAVNQRVSISTGIAFLFVSILVFVRSAFFDITDIQGDRIVGKETIPIIIGEGKTKNLLRFLLGITLLILLASYPLGFTPSMSYPLLACVFYAYTYLMIYERKMISHGILLESMVESNFVLGWLVALAWLFFVL
ncbi:MAG: 4-hydroxy-3-methylbut-2-enyl diphosphate reductase [Thermodesulfobacteriota bacterium]|nr:4-hydroxy-3-methylbut-2-enyl diphosphate reductase [Thermodesulfobacteriota bacterium]